MDNPTGRVVSLADGRGGARAVVEVDVAAACPRCAAGKGCGAGLMQPGGTRRIEVQIPDGIEPRVNDRVEVSLAPHNVLQAAITVYGFPLTGGLAGATFAYALELGDTAAALAALMGVAGGFAASRWRLRQGPCLSRFTPTVERLC